MLSIPTPPRLHPVNVLGNSVAIPVFSEDKESSQITVLFGSGYLRDDPAEAPVVTRALQPGPEGGPCFLQGCPVHYYGYNAVAVCVQYLA